MKKFLLPFLLIVAFVAANSALAAKPKPVPKTVAFTASYSGSATTKVDGTTATIAATGTGTGTLVGAGKLTGTGTADTSQQPCVPFGGTATIAAAKGTLGFQLKSDASGCGDDGGHVFTLSGHATVTSSTGAIKKAKGASLRFTGVFNRDDGTFTVKFTGTVKK